MTEEHLQKSLNRLWEEHFRIIGEIVALKPDMERIQDNADRASNLGVPEKLREVETEISKMRHRLFVLQLRYARVYSLLVKANIQKFTWN